MSLDNIPNLAREVRLEQAPTHAFVVDGKTFPYLLSMTGPVVIRVSDELFKISLEILLYSQDERSALSIGYAADSVGLYSPNIPIIDGKDFPWVCDDSGFKVSFSHKQIPTLTLTMYARSVVGDYPIVDVRPPKSELWTQYGSMIGGYLVADVVISPEGAGHERVWA